MEISVEIADPGNRLARNSLLRRLTSNQQINETAQPSLSDSPSTGMAGELEAIQLAITTAISLATLALEFVKWRRELGQAAPAVRIIQASGRTTKLDPRDMEDPDDKRYIIRRALVGAPDPRKTRCVLIGVSDYGKPFRELPQVENNLSELRKAFLDPEIWGVPPDRIQTIDDPRSAETVRKAVSDAARDAPDELFVYFAGHGLRDRQDKLLLALPEAGYDGEVQTIQWEELAELIRDSKSYQKIVWLDCCYAGHAVPDDEHGLEEKGSSELLEAARVEDAYLLVATQRHGQANAHDEEGCTAFTGELVDILNKGIKKNPQDAFLNLKSLYQEARSALRVKELPEPDRYDPGNIGKRPHFHNKWTPPAEPENREEGRKGVLAVGRTISRGRLWYIVGAGVLALIVIAGLLVFSLTPGEKVGTGLDLAKYCSALAPGQGQRFELNGTTACDQTVDLNAACVYSYNATGLEARFGSASPYSAECVDPESGASYGGISDMTGYCQSHTRVPDVAATVTTSGLKNPWACQVEINKDVACDTQNNRTDLVAEDEKGLTVCRED